MSSPHHGRRSAQLLRARSITQARSRAGNHADSRAFSSALDEPADDPALPSVIAVHASGAPQRAKKSVVCISIVASQS